LYQTKLTMKPTINNSNEALAFLLQGLYYTETALQEALPACFPSISSGAIKDTFNNYSSSSSNKRLKLERAFNYIMTETMTRRNESIHQLVNEMDQMLSATTVPHLRDMLGIGYLQNINNYKISSYRLANLFAIELELDVVADLLEQVLRWETETSHLLSQLEIQSFTRKQSTSQS
jgi:ferritin-like metal-binding protein YciE